MISARRHHAIIRDLTSRWDRERQELLRLIHEQNDQLCHLAGKPWFSEPEFVPEPEPEEDLDLSPEAAFVDLAS